MSKVLALKKTGSTRMPAAAAKRETNGFRTIMREADDLCAEIQAARAVVGVASETWVAGEHESFVGVLDLLGFKLGKMESLAQSILAETKGGES